MKSITIDTSNIMVISGVTYYYGDVTIDNGDYIVVPDKNNRVAANVNNSGWVIVRGNTYKPSDNTLVRLVAPKSYVDEELTNLTEYVIDYDTTSLRVVQLEDKDGVPLTPYASAKGVILENGEDIETQINHMNTGVISGEEATAISTLSGATDDAVGDVREEGAEYRTDIDELTAHVNEIDAQVFPLKFTTLSITPNFTTWQNTIRVVMGEYDTGEPDIKEEYVKKAVNNVSQGKIYNPTDCQPSFSIVSPIEGMKEVYTIYGITVTNKSKTETLTRYLCFYGGNTAPVMTSDIVMTLSKTLTTGVSFNPTITTTYGQYIWLIVPDYLSINQVKSAGFDVTMKYDSTADRISVGTFGTYKCYRTLNALDDATWKLVIS